VTKSHEHYSARKHPEFVVLEIGGEIGALIIHADAAMSGVEIEISRTGEDDHRSHKEVLERRAGEDAAYTAVFDQLAEGTYTLWCGGQPYTRNVRIDGGVIAELPWPAESLEPAA
jgi:hypothetical protein